MVNAVRPTIVPLAELTAEALSVPLTRIPDGSGHGHYDGPTGWIAGLSMARVDLLDYPAMADAVDELRIDVGLHSVVQSMVNLLHPGGTLSVHRDGPPDHLRYHLPIVTNMDAYWWDEYSDKMHMTAGWWYGPVPYCGILHGAGNPGPTDRIHLVVDFKKGI